MIKINEILGLETEMVNGMELLTKEAYCEISLMTERARLERFLNHPGNASKILIQAAKDGIVDWDITQEEQRLDALR